MLQAKPIKGTSPRSPSPPADAASALSLSLSPKDRAENLMIVDLLRHDLGAVASPATVAVPALFAIESFATVHQLVSTVTAQLSETETGVSALRAAFPPGSMTGAPKLRTCSLLDALENAPRGVYSGCLGFLSAHGPMDWAVVIRSAVLHGGRLSVGAGGAVTALSTPEGEYAEMLLKARALAAAVAAVERAAGG